MSGFERLRRRLEEKANDPKSRPVLYVAFGDSVTQGCMEHGVIEHRLSFPAMVKEAVEARYPTAMFCLVNAGASGDTALESRTRWERDVFSLRPDVVTIGFGVNDAHRGDEGLASYRESLTALIAGIRMHTEADVLFITPNKMMSADNPNVDERDRAHVAAFLRTAAAGHLTAYADAMRDVANREEVPLVDQFLMWERMEREGVDIHTRLANGINHPDRDFHMQLSSAIVERFLKD